MRAADTNVVVRVITRDDDVQVAVADAYIANGAWLSHVVIAEVAWVLVTWYRFRHEDVASAIEMLLDHEHFAIQDSDVVAAALEHFRARPALGFSDCLILETARKAGHLPLGTFDRQLGKLSGTERLS